MESSSDLFRQYDKYSYKPPHSINSLYDKLKCMIQQPILIITTNHRYLGRIQEVNSYLVSINGLDDMFPVEIVLTHIEAIMPLYPHCTNELVYPDVKIMNKM
ncbi:hypothetical protein PVK73_28845 [Bacillus thuringiensis]